VERKRTDRMTLGEFVNEFGETIIDEEEFNLIKQLQDLKVKYRIDYERYKELKAEITYCQNAVEQSRQRLIQEFDSWYNDTYLNMNNQVTLGSGIHRQYIEQRLPTQSYYVCPNKEKKSLSLILFYFFLLKRKMPPRNLNECKEK
jgi:hypothetical protein